MRGFPGARAAFALAMMVAGFGFLASACGRPSEEARIRDLLDDAASLAEKRDVDGFMELLTPDFKDFEGRDKAGTVQLVTDHLSRYSGVVIHVLGLRPGVIEPDGRADVECEVCLSHGAAEALRRLIRFGGEYYRFRLGLRKDGAGKWRFASAEWASIGLPDLFPESLPILRKLFPEY